jgi:hypothetical protein
LSPPGWFRRLRRGADELTDDRSDLEASYPGGEGRRARYKIDKDACSSLSGNAKDICRGGGANQRRQG